MVLQSGKRSDELSVHCCGDTKVCYLSFTDRLGEKLNALLPGIDIEKPQQHLDETEAGKAMPGCHKLHPT